MKHFLLLGIFLLVSCGETPPGEGSILGQFIIYEPQALSQVERTQITNICNAISYKTNNAPSLVGNSYTFDKFEKSCSQREAVSAGSETVTIQTQNSSYRFFTSANLPFMFPDIETLNTGSMASICDDVGALETQTLTGNTLVAVQTLGISQSDCVPNSNESCVLIRTALLDNGNTYKVITAEVIKFKINDPKRGFFTEKTLLSFSDCETGKYVIKKAVLK